MHKKAYYTKEGVLQFLNSNVVSYDREEVALYFAKLGMSAYLYSQIRKKNINMREFIGWLRLNVKQNHYLCSTIASIKKKVIVENDGRSEHQ